MLSLEITKHMNVNSPIIFDNKEYSTKENILAKQGIPTGE